jgi:hypothetical protein
VGQHLAGSSRQYSECDDARRQGFPAPAALRRISSELLNCSNHPTLHSGQQASGLTLSRGRVIEMAQEITTPSLQGPPKQDKAQFEDCTPCRVVGKVLDSHVASISLNNAITNDWDQEA